MLLPCYSPPSAEKCFQYTFLFEEKTKSQLGTRSYPIALREHTNWLLPFPTPTAHQTFLWPVGCWRTTQANLSCSNSPNAFQHKFITLHRTPLQAVFWDSLQTRGCMGNRWLLQKTSKLRGRPVAEWPVRWATPARLAFARAQRQVCPLPSGLLEAEAWERIWSAAHRRTLSILAPNHNEGSHMVWSRDR